MSYKNLILSSHLTTFNQQITDTLGNFDKRVLDFQANRLRELLPPPHLRHMGFEQTAETYGRERRYKYYTHDHYVAVAEREQLDNDTLSTRFPGGYFDLIGGFASVEDAQFYKGTDEFSRFVDAYASNVEGERKGKSKKTLKRNAAADGDRPKRGKKRKHEEVTHGDSATASAPRKKRGRPRQSDLLDATEEIAVGQTAVSAPLVPKKRGRPRKHHLPEEATIAAPVVPKKRGRPRKHPLPDAMDVDSSPSITVSAPIASGASINLTPSQERLGEAVPGNTNASESGTVSAVRRRSGRSRKQMPAEASPMGSIPAGTASVEPLLSSLSNAAQLSVDIADDASTSKIISTPMKKTRGRPRKYPLSKDSSAADLEVTSFAVGHNVDTMQVAPEANAPSTRRRGRPPRTIVDEPRVSGRRGRPPKEYHQEAASSSVQHTDKELLDDVMSESLEHGTENVDSAAKGGESSAKQTGDSTNTAAQQGGLSLQGVSMAEEFTSIVHDMPFPETSAAEDTSNVPSVDAIQPPPSQGNLRLRPFHNLVKLISLQALFRMFNRPKFL